MVNDSDVWVTVAVMEITSQPVQPCEGFVICERWCLGTELCLLTVAGFKQL